MGFFSELKRITTNIVRGTARAAGTVIKKIGQLTGSDFLTCTGIELIINNPHIEKRVDLNDESTSFEDRLSVKKACDIVLEQAFNEAKPIEDKLIDNLEDKINMRIELLSEVMPEELINELEYDIDKEFEDDIHNTLSNYLSVHISSDSDEFVKIVNLDDSVRSEKINEYIQKVKFNAEEKLKNKCIQKEIAVYRKMYQDLEQFFSNERKLDEEMKKNLNDLQEHKNDVEYLQGKRAETIIDIAYMENIRMMTYGD